MANHFGLLAQGERALLEFNEAWASGICYCDPEKGFDAIVGRQSPRPAGKKTRREPI